MESKNTFSKKSKEWLSCLLVGFLFGAFVFGSVLSILHIRFNRIGNLKEAFVIGLYFLIIYGVWVAVVFFFSWPAVELLNGFFSRFRKKKEDAAGKPDSRFKAALFLGFFTYLFFYWFLYFNYGLTYDHYPFGTLKNIKGMLLFLLARSVLITAAVLIVSGLLSSFVFHLHKRGRLRKTALFLFFIFAAVHIVFPLIYSVQSSKKESLPEIQPSIERRSIESTFKVVFVGLDGADWRVIDPLIEKGELPNFTRLVDEGSSGPLRTLKNANSAVIWSSIFTGKTPKAHGIFDFYTIELRGLGFPGIFPVHRTYFPEIAGFLEKTFFVKRHTVNRTFLNSFPVWEILWISGIHFGVLNAPYISFPAFEGNVSEDVFVSMDWESYYTKHGEDTETFNSLLKNFIQPPGFFETIKAYYTPGDITSGMAPLFLELLREWKQRQFLTI
ncbi:MAG: alkaline phosphatase family protein [Candidatus Aminicenantes bacterium]|nr:alkaline phosphatase family protein [Candidatus Aminicenantes bacterium]